MPVQNPRQLHQAWEKACNDRDVDALLELYEPDATVFPQPGSPVTGHAAIREALVGFVAIEGAAATTNYRRDRERRPCPGLRRLVAHRRHRP